MRAVGVRFAQASGRLGQEPERRSRERGDDKVVQVTEYANGKRLIDAPADVIHTRPWRGREGREVTFVYIELPEVDEWAWRHWRSA